MTVAIFSGLSAESICRSCSHWIVYPCIIGTAHTELWRCRAGVTEAGTRTECMVYQREPGSDDCP